MNEEAKEDNHSFCAVNPHCLDKIVSLSDSMNVIASSDIYDHQGIKLWAKGAPVSKSLQEKMLKRRLQQPLEASLEVEAGATMKSIVSDGTVLTKDNPALEALCASNNAKSILRNASSLSLPPPLKLLLTSSREHNRKHYEHSLAVMIICAGLADAVGLNERDASTLILSALVHDIGEMYINPEYLDGKRLLEPVEWKHVASHPCVGQAFIKEFTSFPHAVSHCVLHHHERLDGSGYPFQVSGDDLGTLSTLLSVSDSVSAIVMRGGQGIGERVSVALKIVPEEFPRKAVSFITKTLTNLDDSHNPQMSSSVDDVLPMLKLLQSTRLFAGKLLESTPTRPVANAAEFTLKSLTCLDKSLRATGVYDESQLEVLRQDPDIAGEVTLVLSEVRWRMRNLARNIYLRTEQKGQENDLSIITDLVAMLNNRPTANTMQ